MKPDVNKKTNKLTTMHKVLFQRDYMCEEKEKKTLALRITNLQQFRETRIKQKSCLEKLNTANSKSNIENNKMKTNSKTTMKEKREKKWLSEMVKW